MSINKLLVAILFFLVTLVSDIGYASEKNIEPREVIIHSKYTWLIKGSAQEGFFAWPSISPGSDQVVFTMHNRQKKFPLTDRLNIFNLRTKNVSLLLPNDFPYRATRPAWSLTNNLIIFTAQMKNGLTFIVTTNPQNQKEIHEYLKPENNQYPNQPNKTITEIGYLYPSWFPDGISFAAMKSDPIKNIFTNIYFNTKDKKIKNLTDPHTLFSGMATVSPDGKAIVFAGQIKSPVYAQFKNQIWIKPLYENPRRLNVTQGRAPSWSPNANWILYESHYGNKDGNYSIHIQQANREGPIYNLNLADKIIIQHPKWSPDGKFIIADAIKHEKGSWKFQPADNDYVPNGYPEISGLIQIPVPTFMR